MNPVDRVRLDPGFSRPVVEHTLLLDRSLRRWTGRGLVEEAESPVDLARRVFEAPWVLVSHGPEADPILNYGNRAALTLWELTWEELTRMPSRLTAEAPARDERARLLEAVARQGYIDDYAGIRISKGGRRFRIERATVWNVVTAEGARVGQAARFDRWEYL